MADAVKRKRKAYYANHKKSKLQFVLEPGLKGFLCTCNFQERQCVREAYNLLNEYADQLCGEEKNVENNKKSGDTSSEEEEDVQSALAREVDDLKSEQGKAPNTRRFQIVESGATNCLFIRTTVEDPVTLVETILKDIEATQKQKTRYLLRLLPIEETCKAWPDDIEEAAGRLLDKYFKGEPRTFSVVFNRRNNNNVLREELIQDLAAGVKSRNCSHRADMKNPDLSIVVEVIRNMCCLSVVPRYFHYRKYNLIEMAKPRPSMEANSETEKKGNLTTTPPEELAEDSKFSQEQIEDVKTETVNLITKTELSNSEVLDKTETENSVMRTELPDLKVLEDCKDTEV